MKRRLTKHELDINIGLGLMFLFTQATIFYYFLKIGLKFIRNPPILELPIKELTKLTFALLGFDFVLVSLLMPWV